MKNMDEKTRKILMAISRKAFSVNKEVAPIVATKTIFDKVFNRRITTPASLSYYITDFPELKRISYKFKSDKNQMLQGYMYFYAGLAPKAVIILAHGFGGGGQRTYMDVIDYLSSQGFCVFAYDATGNDESEGEGIGGFPQQVIDLKYAIELIEKTSPYNKLPLCLFGHSMGGYAVCNILNYHPEIKAVVSCSGFNKSSAIVKYQAENFAPGEGDKALPHIEEYEQMLFGNYSKTTALDGFKNSQAKVMIIHSEDDPTIPIGSGFDLYYSQYKNNPRFEFIRLKNSGHGTVYYSQEGITYFNNYLKGYRELSKQKEVSQEELDSYHINHLNRDRWTSLIDIELFDKIVTFYNKSI